MNLGTDAQCQWFANLPANRKSKKASELCCTDWAHRVNLTEVEQADGAKLKNKNMKAKQRKQGWERRENESKQLQHE